MFAELFRRSGYGFHAFGTETLPGVSEHHHCIGFRYALPYSVRSFYADRFMKFCGADGDTVARRISGIVPAF